MRLPPDERATTLNAKASATNAACTVTIAADADNWWVVDEIILSLDRDFTAVVSLTVTFGSTEVLNLQFQSKGVYVLPFENGLMNRGNKNEACVISLEDGTGASDKASINVNYR